MPGREFTVGRTEKLPSRAEIKAAQQRTETRAQIEPRADRVRYSEKSNLIVLDLKGGVILALPVKSIRELAGAKPSQLRTVRAGFGGESITLEGLDVDISIPGLLRDLVGITSAASLLGTKGGSVRSVAKAVAVRANGKLGGRPRKVRQSA
jgi:hypothetical protein